eukprot:1325754-Pleurochrysis_carterae.AAC.1
MMLINSTQVVSAITIRVVVVDGTCHGAGCRKHQTARSHYYTTLNRERNRFLYLRSMIRYNAPRNSMSDHAAWAARESRSTSYYVASM